MPFTQSAHDTIYEATVFTYLLSSVHLSHKGLKTEIVIRVCLHGLQARLVSTAPVAVALVQGSL